MLMELSHVQRTWSEIGHVFSSPAVPAPEGIAKCNLPQPGVASAECFNNVQQTPTVFRLCTIYDRNKIYRKGTYDLYIEEKK
jgi:hypothetical protein